MCDLGVYKARLSFAQGREAASSFLPSECYYQHPQHLERPIVITSASNPSNYKKLKKQINNKNAQTFAVGL